MVTNKRWDIEVRIDEHDRTTRAIARLHRDTAGQDETGRDETGLVGVGLAHLNPADPRVPEIGDELAVARALSELSHRLLETAAGDIERSTRRPAHLSR